MINRIVNSDVRATDETINNIVNEFKSNNAELCFKDKYGNDELIDAIEGNRVYILALCAKNKIDKITIEELDLLGHLPNYVLISAHLKWNLKEWEIIYESQKNLLERAKIQKNSRNKEIIGKRYIQ